MTTSRTLSSLVVNHLVVERPGHHYVTRCCVPIWDVDARRLLEAQGWRRERSCSCQPRTVRYSRQGYHRLDAQRVQVTPPEPPQPTSGPQLARVDRVWYDTYCSALCGYSGWHVILGEWDVLSYLPCTAAEHAAQCLNAAPTRAAQRTTLLRLRRELTSTASKARDRS